MKSSIVIVFSILSFTFSSFAQRHSFDLIFGLDETFRIYNGPSPVGNEKKTNFRFGFNYNQQLHENLWIKMGARYSNVGFHDAIIKDIRWPSEIGPNGWEPNPDLPRTLKLGLYHNFIDIPINLRYYFDQHKLFSLYLEGGMGFNYYINSHRNSYDTTGTPTKVFTKEDDIRKIQPSLLFGFGIDVKLKKSIILFLQPTARVHLTSNYKDTFQDYNLYNYGIETGFRYVFEVE